MMTLEPGDETGSKAEAHEKSEHEQDLIAMVN